MEPLSRLQLLASSALLTGGAMAADGRAAEDTPPAKLKVLVAGGHPDDPESGCAGTIARYTDLGHEVVVVYLTRGEAGIKDKSHAQAATARPRTPRASAPPKATKPPVTATPTAADSGKNLRPAAASPTPKPATTPSA